jgi:excisionase family DNA binding protein
MEIPKPQEAAKLVSVSYPTMKQWIYSGKVRSIKTPGGRHRTGNQGMTCFAERHQGD